jgi:hypothetical protein
MSPYPSVQWPFSSSSVLPSLNHLTSVVATGLFGVGQEFVTVLRQSGPAQSKNSLNEGGDLQIVYKFRKSA